LVQGLIALALGLIALALRPVRQSFVPLIRLSRIFFLALTDLVRKGARSRYLTLWGLQRGIGQS